MNLFEEALMMLDQALSRVRMSYDGQGDDVLEELIEEAVKRLEAEFAALIADVIEAEKAAGTVIAEYDNGIPIFWCREPGCQLPGEHMGGHSSTVPKVFMQEPRDTEFASADEYAEIKRTGEMPVSWGYRYEAGMMDDGDWRVGGIA